MVPALAPRPARLALLVVSVAALASLVTVLARSPSADRDWAEDQARLPSISLVGDRVTLGGVRDFSHTADGTAEARWRDETFELADVRRVWLALAPFASRFRGLAHSFLSFELGDGRFLAISVEARREADERYSLIGGLLEGFELAYVIGTERDLIGLRALRGDRIYLYPTVATPEQARALLVDMLRRAQSTQVRPEFYNTLVNNCTTNLRDHVNRVTEADLPWGWGVVLPGYSDRLALDHGLLDTDQSLSDTRRRFRVDERARAALAAGGAEFSRRIRDADPTR